MSAKEPHARVTLTLRCAAQPLQGNVTQDGGQTEPFHGWLELISILHGISNGTTAATTATPSQRGLERWRSPAVTDT